MADNNVRTVLQGFADASEAAYGAVVYLQCFLHNGAAKVSILASKSRVAPIRVISIPRLELCVCVLLAQFVKKIRFTLSRPLVTSQLMGNLPRDSLVPDYLFNCSGVDFCGPFMISRRSKCAKLYSDNGKTFVGANKKLKRFVKLIEDSDDNLAGFLSAEGIEWKFIPPRVPSFGGLWEASVKSIKYHLKRVISGSNLTYQEFLIVCIQIEGILNSRALCPLSSNSDDLNALTPAHFLIGRSMTSVVEPNLIELKENALKNGNG
ncbi:integrase catalytic domain-containing protein [Trichonephila clavipes]|nr:integrase catalytic domain-containing protein [Trichonephila clavipes]